MISVIIPNLNGAKYLPSLFASLKENNLATLEIIFVDNGSVDNSLTLVKKLFPQTIIIKNFSNLGFAAAVNQGIRVSHRPYVCLLNNDLVLDKNWFKHLSAAIKTHPQIACFCGTVLNQQGTAIESQGIDFDWSGKCIQNNHLLKIKNFKLKISSVWGASAAAVIYKKDIIQKIGLFDEKYFAYLEDVDMGFRLHQKNYHTLLVPEAVVYHLGGGTSDHMGNFRARQTFKNWYYFIFKNYSFSQIVVHLPAIFLERLRNFSFLLKSTIK